MAFTIVVGYDGSRGGRSAVKRALQMAKQTDGKVIVACAYGSPGIPWGSATLRDAEMQNAEDRIREALALAENEGVTAEGVVVDDTPTDGLLDVALRHDAGVIVVGTNGRAAVEGVFLGSTVFKLLHRAKVPVLVVPPED